MRELPQGDELLEYAREILRTELLAVLPAEHRLTGLMIANAMGIAARQLKVGDELEYQELDALKHLLSQLHIQMPSVEQNSARLSTTELNTQLNLYNRELAKAIRARNLNDQRSEVFAHLQQISKVRLTESSGV